MSASKSPHKSLRDEGSGSHSEPTGRSRELALIDLMLRRLSGSGIGATALIDALPGMGKTMLLNVAVARGQELGLHVLQAVGVESEVTIAGSGLHQLLFGIRKRFDCLPAGQREVLGRAIGLSPETAPDQFAISVAVVALLYEISADGPLLVVVDDIQWIDRTSAETLSFVARRLHDAHVVLIAAARAGVKGFVDPGAFTVHPMGPLDDQAAEALLEASWPALAAAPQRRILAEAAGNPLALLELPTLLSDEQLKGQVGLPASLPLSDRLEALFAPRIRALPKKTQDLLLLAALDSTGDLRTVWSAAGDRTGSTDSALIPAERVGLVRATGELGKLAFRHPLVRSAIVQSAAPDRRRNAHQALARVLDHAPGRQVEHLIAASLGPEESVANALESAARLALRRGSAAAAVSALRRAADLSPKAEDRARRLAQAAFAATQAGQLDETVNLVDNSYWERAGPRDVARAAPALVYRLMERDGDVDAAHQLLTKALDDLRAAEGTQLGDGPARALADELQFLLILVSFYAHRADLWTQVTARMEGASEFNQLMYDAVNGPARDGLGVHDRAQRVFHALGRGADPRRISQLSWAVVYYDEITSHIEVTRRSVELARTGGAFGDWADGTIMLGHHAYFTGAWEEAESMAREGLRVVSDLGYNLSWCRFAPQLATIEAARGNTDEVIDITGKILAWAEPRGVGLACVSARQALALSAIGQGDYETAYAHCALVSPPGTFPAMAPRAIWTVFDLVEAAVRSGRSARAREHALAAQKANLAHLNGRMALLVGGAAALAASDEKAEHLYEAALALPGSHRWPFCRARVELAYGQWLRRAKGNSMAAREHLQAAVTAFDLLGAKPWSAQAVSELRAAGGWPAAGGPRTAEPSILTRQELEIAEFAASGMSNKQIASRMFLSSRTVSTHLYRIYPKLGIKSRAALRDALTMSRYSPADSSPVPRDAT